MNPLVVPASTITTAFGTAVAGLIVWALKQWAHVEMPTLEAMELAGVISTLACHFTKDSPTPTVARAAVDVAASKSDAADKKVEAATKEAVNAIPT